VAPLFAFLGEFSLMHWLVVLGIGILLFGKRLPEITRSLGKSVIVLKQGWLSSNPQRRVDVPQPQRPQKHCALCRKHYTPIGETFDASARSEEIIRCECGRLVCPRHICHKRCDSCGKVMCGGCVNVFYRELPGAVDSLGRPKFHREILHYCPECYKAA
jgi:TatA/E family protein of Tat protein translocase